MKVSDAGITWKSTKGNEGLYNGILQSIASLFSSKAADRINEINAQKRNRKDGKTLSKEQQKRLAHGDRSVDGGYDKKEKDEEDSRRAAENAEALLYLADGIINFTKRHASQQQIINNDDTNDEELSIGGI